MTDPRKVLDDAVEAAATDLLGRVNAPEQVIYRASRAAIIAALPVIGEAMVAVANGMPPMRAISPQHVHANTPADVASAQRAFIERMRG